MGIQFRIGLEIEHRTFMVFRTWKSFTHVSNFLKHKIPISILRLLSILRSLQRSWSPTAWFIYLRYFYVDIYKRTRIQTSQKGGEGLDPEVEIQ